MDADVVCGSSISRRRFVGGRCWFASLRGAGSHPGQLRVRGAPPHIVYVNVDPAGPYDSGTRLLEAVDPSNLAPIGGWPKPDNRYLIVVRPGDYDLADRMLRLPPYVHILGSGIG